MSEKKFKVGDRVSLKQAVDVHIDGGLTQICPGEVGIIDWTNGEDMEVYFGDYVKLELYASQVELVEPTDPRTAFMQELKELLAKYDAEIQADKGCFDVSIGGKYALTIEGNDDYSISANNIMDYDKG